MENNGEKINDYFIEDGVPPMPSEFSICSPYPNLYAYPQQLDCTNLRPMPHNQYRFDHFIKQEDKKHDFELPDKLNNKFGNFIYFSLEFNVLFQCRVGKKIS